MHEVAIANKLADEIRKQIGEKFDDIKAVSIELGELAEITADELREVLADMYSWRAEISVRKAKVKCKCGYVGKPKIKAREHDVVFFECPLCNSLPEVLEGKSIVVKSVTV